MRTRPPQRSFRSILQEAGDSVPGCSGRACAPGTDPRRNARGKLQSLLQSLGVRNIASDDVKGGAARTGRHWDR